MKQPLTISLVYLPREDATRSWDAALDLLADAFAADIHARARAEVGLTLIPVPAEDVPALARAEAASMVGGAR